jgi:N-acetylglucosaminyldiphosphoundecaprenol N-acetyl-beta-D-mannosaminyltransferase
MEIVLPMVETSVPVTELTQNTISSVEILGLPVHNVDMVMALAAVERFIRAGGPHHIITADASMLVMAQEDAELRGIITGADLVTPDSIGVLWAARRQKNPLRERVSGVEIAEQLCARSAERGYRIFFLGAGPDVAALAANKMREKYPGCQIAGVRDGYFSAAETPQINEEIRRSRANILLVAMGIPKQEKWIQANRSALGCSVLIGVGGTLDVLSGTVRRAPRLFQAMKLEWLWRVLSNPKKINKVMLLPRFVRLVRSG